MRKSVKLQVEQSEKRQKVNDLLGKEELTAEERAELDTMTVRMQEIEVELRAALTAEGERREAGGGSFWRKRRGTRGPGTTRIEPATFRRVNWRNFCRRGRSPCNVRRDFRTAAAS